MHEVPIVVVEVDPFPRRAAAIWKERDHEEFIDFIARNREAGERIPGTGGLRKVRWSRQGMGKSGGARVIYYYDNVSAPLYLLTVYAKAQQDDLSAREKAAFRKLVQVLKSELKERRSAR